MSVHGEDFIPEELQNKGEGFCPQCGYPLTNWGAASRGDGDIYDEIGCDRCEEIIKERHATYCTCPDCDPHGLKDNNDDGSWQPCDYCDLPDACEDFGCAMKQGLILPNIF